MKSAYILLVVIVAFFFSCYKTHFYEQQIKVPDNTWHYDSLVNFIVPIDDSLSYYRIFLKIKHDQQYPYANLWLRVIVKCPCGAIRIDTVNIWFQDEKQRWIGTAVGKIWTVTAVYQDSVRFPSRGNFNFYLQHIMRKDDVPYINSIGLVIDKLK